MPFASENLKVYQRAVDCADDVLAITEHFPRGFGFLADQLNRASVSIAANLVEGNGQFTKPDRMHFFGIARGSILECVPLLELAARRGLVEPEQHRRSLLQLDELGRMICGLINGLDKRST